MAEETTPNIRGMVHRADPHTSVEAAIAHEAYRTELHRLVLQAFATYGPMTDEELEQLPEFGRYGPSTLRKRRSELYQAKQLVVVGERHNARGFKMLVWALPPPAPPKRVRRSLYPAPPTVMPKGKR